MVCMLGNVASLDAGMRIRAMQFLSVVAEPIRIPLQAIGVNCSVRVIAFNAPLSRESLRSTQYIFPGGPLNVSKALDLTFASKFSVKSPLEPGKALL